MAWAGTFHILTAHLKVHLKVLNIRANNEITYGRNESKIHGWKPAVQLDTCFSRLLQ